jgi:hypothetical protein
MFPDERVFVVEDNQGRVVSTLLPSSDVTGVQDDHGFVEVRVLGEDGEFSIVMLPGEVLSPSRTLAVRSVDLESPLRNGNH